MPNSYLLNRSTDLVNTRFIIIGLCALLISCGSTEGDDLDQFMNNASKDLQAKIDPIPEVKPYIPHIYNADGTLNDPFKARKAQAGKGIRPDLNRPKGPLEAYPLESLKYVGMLSKEKFKYALIQTPDAGVQQVKVGNYVGQNFGIVTDINESSVTLKEIVQDETSGDWVERMSSLNLQE